MGSLGGNYRKGIKCMTIRITKQNVYSLLLALSPFLVNYDIPILKVNITLLIYMVLAILAVLNTTMVNYQSFREKIKAFSCNQLMIVMLLYLFFGAYYVDNPIGKGHVITQILLLYTQIYGFIYFFSTEENRVKYKECVVNITLIMCTIIFVQYFLYYLFGYLPGGNSRDALIPFKSLFTESVGMTSKQGMIIDGFFRPSALFLEPAHFSAYCSLGLIHQIFKHEGIGWKEFFISLAICMTTSGVGISSVVIVWLIYIFYNFKSLDSKKLVRGFSLIIIMTGVFVVLYFNFSFFRTSLGRFVGTDSALSGRLSGRLFIEQLQGKSKMFGVGYKNFSRFSNSNSSYYFSSITELLYCQGIVGTILFCSLYLVSLLRMYKSKNQENVTAMTVGIIYIVGTGIFSANQIIRYIAFLFV